METGLTARAQREHRGSETPFMTVKTTGETPVPQFCHGLLGPAGDGAYNEVGFRRREAMTTSVNTRETMGGLSTAAFTQPNIPN